MHKPIPMDWQVVFDYQNPPRRRKHDKRLLKWAKAVKARDGYACTRCGSTSKLHAHHVMHKAARPDIRYEVNNGVTLCLTCHAAAHGGGLGLMMVRNRAA